MPISRRTGVGLASLGFLIWLGHAQVKVAPGAVPPPQPAAATAVVRSRAAAEISMAAYAAAPGSHYGKLVSLSGTAERLRPNALSLGGRVLVVGAAPLRDTNGRPIEPDSTAAFQVTGTARPFDAALRRELGLAGDPLARWEHWEGQPAVVARFIEPLGRSR